MGGLSETPPLPWAVDLATDVGPMWMPANCQVITPAVRDTGVWDPDDGEALRRSLRPGMVVVDVGAHVGYFVLLAARAVGPAGKVIAVEPDPDNFRLLEANVARSPYRTISTVHAAAWDRAGTVRLALSGSNSGDHRVGLDEPERRSVTVPAVTLDELLSEESVDLILLDTQGSERTVLEGARACIARSRPLLQAEFWPDGIRALHGDPAAMVRFYRELGYEIAMLEAEVPRDAPPELLVSLAEAQRGGFCTLLLTSLR
jgi:FkbM family methyltransferase